MLVLRYSHLVITWLIIIKDSFQFKKWDSEIIRYQIIAHLDYSAS